MGNYYIKYSHQIHAGALSIVNHLQCSACIQTTKKKIWISCCSWDDINMNNKDISFEARLHENNFSKSTSEWCYSQWQQPKALHELTLIWVAVAAQWPACSCYQRGLGGRTGDSVWSLRTWRVKIDRFHCLQEFSEVVKVCTASGTWHLSVCRLRYDKYQVEVDVLNTPGAEVLNKIVSF